ncbi:MAG: hypothetical protein Q7J57_09820 [Gemmobacter sp.]|nr:hypothetical protein [Gemmobacter sp.]
MNVSKTLPLALLLLLAGCATPQQACIADATAQLSALDAQIAESKATLARGYAVDKVEVTETRTIFCRGGTEAEPEIDTCQEDFHRLDIRRRPVDLTAEARNLTAMTSLRATLAQAAAPAIAQCRATYPH